jgi:hypothetical protein
MILVHSRRPPFLRTSKQPLRIHASVLHTTIHMSIDRQTTRFTEHTFSDGTEPEQRQAHPATVDVSQWPILSVTDSEHGEMQ